MPRNGREGEHDVLGGLLIRGETRVSENDRKSISEREICKKGRGWSSLRNTAEIHW